MKKAKRLLDEQSLMREEMAMMEAWQKQEADFYDITVGFFERGKKQGLQQGESLGMEKGRDVTIQTLAETMSPESIATALKMPVATIMAILSKSKM